MTVRELTEALSLTPFHLTEGGAPDGDLLRRAQEKGVNLLGAGQDTCATAARLSGALAAG